MSNDITRREALQRAAMLLGGTLAAPTILGVLAGCGDRAEKAAAWTPRTLTPQQRDMVVSIAETIIPETNTPGARAARVDEFVDAMLTDHYPVADKERFLTGLARVDARAQRAHGKSFTQLEPAQQTAIVGELDRLAFTAPRREQAGPGGAEAAPRVRQGEVAAGRGAGPEPATAVTAGADEEDTGPKSFFRMMKELAVVGYYTSQVGATRELRVTPWGRYRDIPYTPGTPSWSA
jgi:glucoside 3-dehydrogenase (cytochrome c) hitch-hiker subunit